MEGSLCALPDDTIPRTRTQKRRQGKKNVHQEDTKKKNELYTAFQGSLEKQTRMVTLLVGLQQPHFLLKNYALLGFNVPPCCLGLTKKKDGVSIFVFVYFCVHMNVYY